MLIYFQLSLILSIVQAAKIHGLYAMLGLSLLGQAIIVIILVCMSPHFDTRSEIYPSRTRK